MSTDLDKFIQKTAHYLAMRDKEAGLGGANKGLPGYGKAFKGSTFKGLPGYGKVAVPKGRIADVVEAVQNSPVNRQKLNDIDSAFNSGLQSQQKAIVSGTADKFKAQAQKAVSAERKVVSDGVEKAKEFLRTTRADSKATSAGGAAPDAAKAHAGNTAILDKVKGMVDGDNNLARDLFSRHYSKPGVAEKLSQMVRNTSPRDILRVAPQAAMGNKTLRRAAVGTGVAGSLYAGSDYIGRGVQHATGHDPTANKASMDFSTRPDLGVGEVLKQKPVGQQSGEDGSEETSFMDKLTTGGKDVLGKIQSFASTRAGSGVIGATTGAGLAYLIDKMTTDGDEDEDKVRNRRIITSLLGALGGAAAGMAIQKFATDSPAKVQSLLQQEATAMSDEDLENKVNELEMREKTASVKDFIHRRLRVAFHPRFAA